jgi:thymidylate kinase
MSSRFTSREPDQIRAPALSSDLSSWREGAQDIAEDRCRGSLLRDAARVASDEGLRLCVLHGHDRYPERIESDLDCVCHEPRRIPHMLARHGLPVVVQAIEHERNALYYVLYRRCGGRFVFVALDVSRDYRRDGRLLFSGQRLLSSCRAMGEIDILPPDLEFAAYLVKKILKMRLEHDHVARLSALYAQDPEACRQQVDRFFAPPEADLIVAAASARDWLSVQTQVGKLRRQLRKRLRRESPSKVMRYWADDFRRRVMRILQPTGLAIAVLGADGAGKSTLVRRLEGDLAPVFRRTSHHRPQSTRLFRSVFGTAVWSVYRALQDAWSIHPRLIRSTLVVIEGDYYDRLIDHQPQRTRGARWLARAAARLVVRPQLVIVLDVAAEVLVRRRSSVGIQELAGQREAYLLLAERLRNAYVVDASRSRDEIAVEVEGYIIKYMVGRLARRLNIHPANSG